MTKMIFTVVCVGCAILSFAGQRATEQFIPMGQSPGISGEYARRGTVDDVDTEARRVTISTEAGPIVIEIADDTNIWVDRSQLGQSNVEGTIADLVEGAEVEVLSKDHVRHGEGPAEWIKVRKPD